MAVIPFPLDLSPQGPNPQMQWGLRTLSARQMSPLNGVATTLERAGSHWSARLPYESLAESRRARLQTFAASCRGYANRFYMPLFGWTRRGSFPATELFTNNTFASGTTGWSALGGSSLSVSDGLARLTVTGVGSNPEFRQQNTLTQYVPYALRSLLIDGPQTAGLTIGRALSDSVTTQVSDYSTTRGLGTIAFVPDGGTGGSQFPAVFSSTSGYTAGAYLTVGYTSLARCALVDNGPNLLQQSDSVEHADWTKFQATGSAVAGTAPDGAADASALIEDGSAGEHRALQTRSRTSVAEDLCAFGYFKRRTGTRNLQLLVDDGSLNGAFCVFDLGAGTAGSVSLLGTGTNGRAFIVNVGNSWYYCALVARCPASTSARQIFWLHNTTTNSYTGDSTSSIYAWRCGVARSGVPTRGMQTTSAGDDDGTLQTGSALYLKGLPASTDGLLLQGDPVEIITNTSSQLVRARSALNSDAAGLGYFEFEPPLRVSPLDNAAVIVCNPLCRMMLDSPNVDWMERAAGFSDFEFAAVEDTYP